MTRKKRATGFHPSSFGGWPDYQQWADNDFRPCPEQPVEPEPEPIPEPEPVPFAATIATTLWSPDPVIEEPIVEPPPVEPLSPPGWQAFEEVEPVPEPLLWRPAADEDPLAETAWPPPTETDLPAVEPVLEPVLDTAEVEPVAEPPVWEAFTRPEVLPVIDRQALLDGWPPESRDRGWTEEWADEDLVVRPYVRTHGRVTQGYDLRLETLVSATGRPSNPALTPDAALICGLCRTAPQSVAEVSAHLNAPLGVARVLIADAIEAGLVVVDQDQPAVDARPSREMLERIREGLMRMS